MIYLPYPQENWYKNAADATHDYFYKKIINLNKTNKI